MIRTRGLTKDFVVSRTQTVHAVRGIDLDVAPGELVAVLGPNGAGKTTTMRMLTTLVRPTAGTATVAGVDVLTDPAAVRRRIGYVGQGNGAGRSQHVVDELVVHGRVHGLTARTARTRAHDLLDALDLAGLAHRKVESLSGGQRRRVDVALGLVHGPRLLFLDEPSTGLDPHTRANLWTHVLRLRAEHDMTIVLTTHYLDEADTMAERVVVVDHGRIIADDTADALKRDLAGDRLVLTVARTDDAGALAGLLGRVPGAREVEVDGTRVTARVADAPSAAPHVVRTAAAAGLDVTEVRSERPTLDDVFLALTGRSLRDAGATAAPDSSDDEAAAAAGKDAA
ncbi:ATP-binding cassette domain-containing protein [Cellulomonas sp. S1-8]|uniref:ATP-binding cassette domain-containing protein n=1 Tax=Cellulomonas sp. S1-8 TaxID=2904790 RepID=UPI002243C175|nr:ATP-binding cassette domain-containing protein [Cellulomonas sp. S1-8]UZN01986.1 ATP-binding cassette domain-containing protein [Cellulomonas sp. S1-8]